LYLQNVLIDINNIKVFDQNTFGTNSNCTYILVKEGTEKHNGILGNGKFGIVYKVKGKRGKVYALKKFIIPFSSKYLLINEIQNLIRCKNCKNVIKIVDCYRSNDIYIGKYNKEKYTENDKAHMYYVIMDFYDCIDISKYIESIKDNKQYNDKYKTEKYIYQMINAVKQLHDKGVYHFDIKPENFMLNSEDEVFLGDFGLSSTEAVQNNHYGTPPYLLTSIKKFENVSQSKNLDIYALACTIYVLCQLKSFCNCEQSQIHLFDPVSRWENCYKNNIHQNLQLVLGSIFNNPSDENLSMETFTGSEYYKYLESKYGKK
jgi:serine/threonine protein kinase